MKSPNRTPWHLLILFSAFALFLHLWYPHLPCFSTDEAAFAYNAYSLLKTGKDEYGIAWPQRLVSFSDYKLPLQSYLEIPFIAAFGLNEWAARLPVLLASILLPMLVYFLTRLLTPHALIALSAAFFTAVSPWVQIVGRHAHETVLALFFFALAAYFFLLFTKKRSLTFFSFFSLFLALSLYSYHTAKITPVIALVWLAGFFITQKPALKKIILYLLIFFLPLAVFIWGERIMPSSRVQNLLFITSPGFIHEIEEARRLGGSPLIYNKLVYGGYTLFKNYTDYFTPPFLTSNGDANHKFGMKGIAPITYAEYVLFILGVVYLLKNRLSYRLFLFSWLFLAPLPAALAFIDASVTRSFLLTLPLLIIAAHGMQFLYLIKPRLKRNVIFAVLAVLFAAQLTLSWATYFGPYRTSPQTSKSWGCGYKEVMSIVNAEKDTVDAIYFTRRWGMPYIYVLFYSAYPPDKYQKEAHITLPDEYGYGQVLRFDIFTFETKAPNTHEKALYIWSFEEYENFKHLINEEKARFITHNGYTMFVVYKPY